MLVWWGVQDENLRKAFRMFDVDNDEQVGPQASTGGQARRRRAVAGRSPDWLSACRRVLLLLWC